MQDLITVRTI